jgi:predicted phage gp36 major capsid-like protein
MTDNLTERVTVRLASGMRARIEALAATERRKASDWIRLALEDAAGEQECRARIDDRLSPSRRSPREEGR